MRFTIPFLTLICTAYTCIHHFQTDEAVPETIEERDGRLTMKYLEQLAHARREYESGVIALRQKNIADLQLQLETAMKELNLEKSNSLNREILRLESEIAVMPLRTVFVEESKPGESTYFIRGLNDEWIQRSVSRSRGGDDTQVYKTTDETLEYVELTSESDGSVHRLFNDVRMKTPKGRQEFTKKARGTWRYADAAAAVATTLPKAAEEAVDRLKEQAINEHQTHSAAKHWAHNDGFFLQGPGGDWVEKYENGKFPPNLFREVRRTEEFVELQNYLYPITVRLHKDRVMVKDLQKGHQHFMKYYEGSWKALSPNAN